MAKDYPSQFGRSELYRNPDGTLPMPSPNDIPRPFWGGQKQQFRWEGPFTVNTVLTPLPPGVEYRYRWLSPTFDLRPDLRSSHAAPKDGLPMWSSSARLYVQLMMGAGGSSTQPELDTGGLTALAADWVNDVTNFSSDRQAGEGITGGAGLLRQTDTNVTAIFSTGPSLGPAVQRVTTVLGVFSPPGTTSGTGEGYPVRYWRLELNFRFVIETGLPIPDPPPPPLALVLQPSMY